jgi:hypothetical protein
LPCGGVEPGVCESKLTGFTAEAANLRRRTNRDVRFAPIAGSGSAKERHHHFVNHSDG